MQPGRSASDLTSELAALLEQAKDVPLMKSFVRLDPSEAKRLSGSLLEASEPTSALRLAVEETRDAVARAKQVPFTDQVRLRREVAESLAQELRAAAGLPAV